MLFSYVTLGGVELTVTTSVKSVWSVTLKVYYDTEFLEDGKTIELISIGLVTEKGDEYYAINADMPIDRIRHHPWLAANVVPHLPGRYIPSDSPANVSGADEMWTIDLNHRNVHHPRIIRSAVERLLAYAAKDTELELWSWYSAYDHVALCQLWGPMVAKPSFIPHYTNDIRQEFQRWGNPRHNIAEGNHNALADAHYHKTLHEFIIKVGQERYREAVLEALHPEMGYWCDLDNLHKEKN